MQKHPKLTPSKQPTPEKSEPRKKSKLKRNEKSPFVSLEAENESSESEIEEEEEEEGNIEGLISEDTTQYPPSTKAIRDAGKLNVRPKTREQEYLERSRKKQPSVKQEKSEVVPMMEEIPASQSRKRLYKLSESSSSSSSPQIEESALHPLPPLSSSFSSRVFSSSSSLSSSPSPKKSKFVAETSSPSLMSASSSEDKVNFPPSVMPLSVYNLKEDVERMREVKLDCPIPIMLGALRMFIERDSFATRPSLGEGQRTFRMSPDQARSFLRLFSLLISGSAQARRALIDHLMGSGKSVLAVILAIAICIWEKRVQRVPVPASNVIIVTPSQVVEQWQDEIGNARSQFFNNNPYNASEIRPKVMKKKQFFDEFHMDPEDDTNNTRIRHELARSIIIIDEIQGFRRVEGSLKAGQRISESGKMRRILQNAKYVLLVTGTVLYDSMRDFVDVVPNLMKWVEDSQTDLSKWSWGELQSKKIQDSLLKNATQPVDSIDPNQLKLLNAVLGGRVSYIGINPYSSYLNPVRDYAVSVPMGRHVYFWYRLRELAAINHMRDMDKRRYDNPKNLRKTKTYKPKVYKTASFAVYNYPRLMTAYPITGRQLALKDPTLGKDAEEEEDIEEEEEEEEEKKEKAKFKETFFMSWPVADPSIGDKRTRDAFTETFKWETSSAARPTPGMAISGKDKFVDGPLFIPNIVAMKKVIPADKLSACWEHTVNLWVNPKMIALWRTVLKTYDDRAMTFKLLDKFGKEITSHYVGATNQHFRRNRFRTIIYASHTGVLEYIGRCLDAFIEADLVMNSERRYTGIDQFHRVIVTGEGRKKKTKDEPQRTERSAYLSQRSSWETTHDLAIISAAGGVGVNLRGADVVIHYEQPWSPGEQDQIDARGIRYNAFSLRTENARKLCAEWSVDVSARQKEWPLVLFNFVWQLALEDPRLGDKVFKYLTEMVTNTQKSTVVVPVNIGWIQEALDDVVKRLSVPSKTRDYTNLVEKFRNLQKLIPTGTVTEDGTFAILHESFIGRRLFLSPIMMRKFISSVVNTKILWDNPVLQMYPPGYLCTEDIPKRDFAATARKNPDAWAKFVLGWLYKHGDDPILFKYFEYMVARLGKEIMPALNAIIDAMPKDDVHRSKFESLKRMKEVPYPFQDMAPKVDTYLGEHLFQMPQYSSSLVRGFTGVVYKWKIDTLPKFSGIITFVQSAKSYSSVIPIEVDWTTQAKVAVPVIAIDLILDKPGYNATQFLWRFRLPNEKALKKSRKEDSDEEEEKEQEEDEVDEEEKQDAGDAEMARQTYAFSEKLFYNAKEPRIAPYILHKELRTKKRAVLVFDQGYISSHNDNTRLLSLRKSSLETFRFDPNEHVAYREPEDTAQPSIDHYMYVRRKWKRVLIETAVQRYIVPNSIQYMGQQARAPLLLSQADTSRCLQFTDTVCDADGTLSRPWFVNPAVLRTMKVWRNPANQFDHVYVESPMEKLDMFKAGELVANVMQRESSEAEKVTMNRFLQNVRNSNNPLCDFFTAPIFDSYMEYLTYYNKFRLFLNKSFTQFYNDGQAETNPLFGGQILHMNDCIRAAARMYHALHSHGWIQHRMFVLVSPSKNAADDIVICYFASSKTWFAYYSIDGKEQPVEPLFLGATESLVPSLKLLFYVYMQWVAQTSATDMPLLQLVTAPVADCRILTCKYKYESFPESLTEAVYGKQSKEGRLIKSIPAVPVTMSLTDKASRSRVAIWATAGGVWCWKSKTKNRTVVIEPWTRDLLFFEPEMYKKKFAEDMKKIEDEMKKLGVDKNKLEEVKRNLEEAGKKISHSRMKMADYIEYDVKKEEAEGRAIKAIWDDVMEPFVPYDSNFDTWYNKNETQFDLATLREGTKASSVYRIRQRIDELDPLKRLIHASWNTKEGDAIEIVTVTGQGMDRKSAITYPVAKDASNFLLITPDPVIEARFFIRHGKAPSQGKNTSWVFEICPRPTLGDVSKTYGDFHVVEKRPSRIDKSSTPYRYSEKWTWYNNLTPQQGVLRFVQANGHIPHQLKVHEDEGVLNDARLLRYLAFSPFEAALEGLGEHGRTRQIIPVTSFPPGPWLKNLNAAFGAEVPLVPCMRIEISACASSVTSPWIQLKNALGKSKGVVVYYDGTATKAPIIRVRTRTQESWIISQSPELESTEQVNWGVYGSYLPDWQFQVLLPETEGMGTCYAYFLSDNPDTASIVGAIIAEER